METIYYMMVSSKIKEVTTIYMVTSSKNKEENTIYMMFSVTEIVFVTAIEIAVTGSTEMTVVTVTVSTEDKFSKYHIEQQLMREENVNVTYSLITARR